MSTFVHASHCVYIQTKPHGHGDVHALLHSTGLAKKWNSQGFKWVAFFQVNSGSIMDKHIPGYAYMRKLNLLMH